MKTHDLVMVSVFSALTALGAFIKIPIPYVPFTLQFLFCAMAGIVLGPKLGALSQALYVLIGLIGIPVFTEGGGLYYIFKPTFGYLIGFIIAAYIIGMLSRKVENLTFVKTLLCILSGLFFVYLFGVVHLYIIYNLYIGEAKTLKWAIFYGFIICVGGDILVSMAASALSLKLKPIAKFGQE
ncbi:putative biotin transporter BioY [Clostridium pasteurianum DSM 525 = ATCC 6013]|uniref:Biotin transporter n=1 Tax=Clostridium pasteurianum DSM 525 = ATCC 6013 TaxID=1262449 RepID=A0A0H3J287_CLOPA|nr:biotin transporter BioY [Clostridium pasteurianum]AJA46882.1 putative biotin transporter BioY [Clostridium pasteurianum DSM 525 = ATCC 6013]AJA50870.1 putative biotin transporter BioY [Clostridium pasteurianum DSM 525 = ATCC 6013]ELP58131.1 biotin synthesis protein [Clostridium pasteurianum DSM 525 = ATCC 6013]KRU13121.1 BioY protein [Clostridium pasteurianum DSM 525 = ATCC 6013]